MAKTAKKPAAKKPAAKHVTFFKTKTKAAKGKAPKKAARKPSAATTKAVERHKLPARQALPGFAQVFDPILDRACKSIAEFRDVRNEAVAGEKSEKQVALRRLSERFAKNPADNHYAAYNVMLELVPGAMELRVKKYTGEKDAVTNAPTPDVGSDDTPETDADTEPENEIERG